jgi:hypothetical protein
MSFNQLSRLLQNSDGAGGGQAQDAPQVDTAEQIYISSLALIKMLKHGASAVPLSARVQALIVITAFLVNDPGT